MTPLVSVNMYTSCTPCLVLLQFMKSLEPPGLDIIESGEQCILTVTNMVAMVTVVIIIKGCDQLLNVINLLLIFEL